MSLNFGPDQETEAGFFAMNKTYALFKQSAVDLEKILVMNAWTFSEIADHFIAKGIEDKLNPENYDLLFVPDNRWQWKNGEYNQNIKVLL